MKTEHFAKLGIILCLAAFALPAVHGAEKPNVSPPGEAKTHNGVKTPNIILILADDMSYDSVSFLNDQIGNMKTPHIDSIARNGMSFTDAHSGSAVCTPTRYGLLTGRYAWRTRLKREVLWSYGQPLIKPETLTVAEMLQKKGYQTACVGKWHLGNIWHGKDGKPANGNIDTYDKTWGQGKERIAAADKNIDFSKPVTGGPTDNGFDYYFGVDVPNFPPYTWIENKKLTGIPSIPKPKAMFGSPGMMEKGWKLENILPTLARKSAAWIKQAAQKEKPYFLYMSLTSPHTPIAPSKAFQGKSGISTYADFVLETDWAVGQVLAAVEASGEKENTLIIFTADNGTSGAANFKELESHGVNLHNHFRGHKAQIFEGGHRIPLLMSWPAKIKPGRNNHQTVTLNDFMATVADLTGYTLKSDEGVDSTSILKLVTGEADVLPRHPYIVNHDWSGRFAIRNNHWKLLFPYDSKEAFVLYDLKKDIKETTNVAAKHPDIVKKMTAALRNYVEAGRSTEGKRQPNDDNLLWWKQLPWKK